ncbi:uncharacterized protein RJT21DRAFT_2098 [Scheffersomyces amazonensis]|uniref:uncharacterized protein n=1 Tax=Scheffersomyces amazonensis TaxID=1078765 RepID=UPI00315C8DE0
MSKIQNPNYFQPRLPPSLPPPSSLTLIKPPNIPKDHTPSSHTLGDYISDSDSSVVVSLSTNKILMSSSPEALNRLEVESTSTSSLPISIPYYLIDNNSHNYSMDTISLLNKSDESPQYPNTQHLNITPNSKSTTNNNNPNITQTSNNQTQSSKSQSQSIQHTQQKPHVKIASPFINSSTNVQSEHGDSSFNQVPKRFSHFIIDQQSPYIAQRLDNLSDGGSMTIDSESEVPGIVNTTRLRDPSALSKRLSNSDSVSNSASQVTIFSTRPSPIEAHMPRVRNSKLQFKRKGSIKQKFDENDQLYTALSNTSTLTRQSTIRCKEGGIFYRLKLRLRKLVKRLNFLKFNNFKASSKKSHPSMKRQKTKTLKRKVRENPRNISIRSIMKSRKIASISNPLNNPDLGDGRGAQRVTTIDDQLKYLAGAPIESVNLIQQQEYQQDGKLRHISKYIDQQIEYATKLSVPRSQTIEYRTNPLAESSPDDERIQLPEFRNETINDDDNESLAPPPPPHLLSSNHNYSKFHGMDVPDLWRSYLGNVIYKRILLRQEISLFQKFMAENETQSQSQAHDITNNTNTNTNTTRGSVSDVFHSEYGIYSSIKSSTVSEITTTPSDISSILSEEDMVPSSPDEEQVFQQKILNRRSILGEMLEYDSDTDSNASSIGSASSAGGGGGGSSYYGSSIMDSARSEILVQRYGTQQRSRGKNINMNKRIITQPTMRPQIPLTRSNGFQHNLNQV